MENFNYIFLICNFLIIFWYNVGIVQGIVGGKEVSIHKYKFMVSVEADGKHICGGCIISNEFVLTAAQCVIDRDNKFKNERFSIVAGIDDLQLKTPLKIEDSVEIIYVPREYDPRLPDAHPKGDLAVLKLKNSLERYTNTLLQVAEIPTRKSNHFLRYYYKRPTMLGFGSTIRGRGIKRDREDGHIPQKELGKLKSIEAEVLHKNSCKSIFPFPLVDKHLAAQAIRSSDLSVGVCTGDIGGPLIFEGNTVIGVLSRHTHDCDENYYAGLYTRVTSYVPFINRILDNKPLKNEARFATYKRRNNQNDPQTSNELDLVEVTEFVPNILPLQS